MHTSKTITIQAVINAPAAKVWKLYKTPEEASQQGLKALSMKTEYFKETASHGSALSFSNFKNHLYGKYIKPIRRMIPKNLS